MTEAPGELRLARKNTKRRGQGEGRTALPLRRSYVRDVVEQKPKHGGKQVANTRTPEEIEEIRATMAMPAGERVARLEAAMRELDKEAAVTNSGTEEMRMAGAALLDREAMLLSGSGGFGVSGTEGSGGRDYADAVGQAVADVGRSARDEEEVRGSVHRMDRSEYEAEMKKIMEERGYDD